MLTGSRILEMLKEQGLSQRQLADALHLDPATVNGYIHGRRYPDCATLALIASFLHTNMDYLLGNTGIRSYPELSLSPEEDTLVSSYRSMDEDCKMILIELAATLHTHSSSSRQMPSGRQTAVSKPHTEPLRER